MQRDNFEEKLVDDLTEKNSQCFWQRIRSGLSNTRMTSTSRVGGAFEVQDILNLWQQHFSAIVNGCCPDQRNTENKLLEEAFQRQRTESNQPWWFVETHPREVEKAISRLKRNKAPGSDELRSEHLIYGSFTLVIFLSVAFTGFLRHSFVPYQFLSSFIVPILKDRNGDATDPDNYRGVAISSATSKVLELLLLERLKDVLGSGDQQFGFRQGHGCADCSYVLKKTVDYYLSNGNNEVFVSALDLSKAYDRIVHYRLFRKLLDRGGLEYLVRLLANWYSSQYMRVNWNAQLSEAFGVTNGVRQGSVMSPCLFNIYIDDLLMTLKHSGYGAKIGENYVGGVAYADDVTLISPTRYGIQKMLDVCTTFARQNGLIFNSKKSMVTVFTSNRRLIGGNPDLILSEKPIPFRTEITHLGTIMDRFRRDKQAIEARIRKFLGGVNGLVSKLGGVCRSEKVWTRLVEVQLFPILSYGCHMWELEKSSDVKMLNTAFRKGIRRGLGMRRCESICDRFQDFIEAAERVKDIRRRFLQIALNSVNGLVRSLRMLHLRESKEY